MKKVVYFFLVLIVLLVYPLAGGLADTTALQLGSDDWFGYFNELWKTGKVSVVTNQTGSSNQGGNMVDLLYQEEGITFTALFAPGHGLNGLDAADVYVQLAWIQELRKKYLTYDDQPATETEKEEEKIAYLTFDDGPSQITHDVLDVLQEHNIKATFFVVGRNIKGREEIMQRIVAEGHLIGGHTYSHDYRTLYRDVDSFFQDFDYANELIEQTTGVKPTVFRYPGGSSNLLSKKYQDPQKYSSEYTVMKAIISEANRRGLYFVDWNVENGDGKTNKYTAQSSLEQIKRQVNNQKEIVVLLHDSAPKKQTAESLPAIIAFLKEKGYSFGTLEVNATSVALVK